VDSQQLLYIILILFVFLFGIFLTIRRKPDQPTKLNVKAGENFTSNKKIDIKAKRLMEDIVNPRPIGDLTSEELNKASKKYSTNWSEPEQPLREAKNLSIFFMYNGHDWEAHDVLGIPQGGSLTLATEKYQKLIKSEDPSTFEFYESAYNAILQRRKKERL
jgi:hypothetical protein